MIVATTEIPMDNPKPLVERSNSHHRPRDMAASVTESWKLFSKSTFCFEFRMKFHLIELNELVNSVTNSFKQGCLRSPIFTIRKKLQKNLLFPNKNNI